MREFPTMPRLIFVASNVNHLARSLAIAWPARMAALGDTR